METYYQRNKERILAERKIYQANNKEKMRAYNRQYFQENKSAILSRNQAKRAQKPAPVKSPKPKKVGRYVQSITDLSLFVPEPEPEPESVVYIRGPIVVSFD